MEGGGERKRKAGPIVLDWDALLPPGKDEDEPPTVVVVKEAAERSNPFTDAAMGGGEEQPPIDPYFSKVSIKDLQDKIARVKGMLLNGTRSSLPDGGEKLRVNLKTLQAELERRKALKDDDKCKKVTLQADESTCNGAHNGLSRGDSDRDSQSTFASHFRSKLDDERGSWKSKVFEAELSTLYRCGSKNTRADEQLPSKKIGFSSREAPFRSPSHLSVNIDDPPQSKFKLSEIRSCTPFRHSDRAGCFAKRGNAPRVQPSRRCSRNNRNTVVLVDEEEHEIDATSPKDQVDQSFKKNPIYYPSREDPAAIEIRYSDMECLAPESYLSSTIMNFYILYLQKPASPSTRRGCNYYFFNTYFYEKLKQFLRKTDEVTSFVKFRRWWKGVNMFEKAYIFLPIHENLHWSLVIICIPDKEDESGPVILHLDSLGLHSSKSIFSDVKSFLMEEWKFLRQEEVLPELPIANNIWNRLSQRIDEKVIEVPQQRNEYDCGLFVLYFMERFIDEAPERLKKKDLEMFGRQWFKPEQASSLRSSIRDILRQEFKNANTVASKLDT